MKNARTPKLSIIILNYNSRKLLIDCLNSLKNVKDEIKFEIIVSDNGSSDDSDIKLIIVENKENLGFAKGNNRAKNFISGEYVLFLNTDTIVFKDTLNKTVNFLAKDVKIGALTCKLVMANGKLDKDARRSFITPWIGLTHIYLKLDRLFPKSKLFSQYWYGYIPENVTHEVDVVQGAYFLTRKKILDEVNWFDEDYFLDGEDIDLCWKIKKKGYKVYYYPEVSILHLKGATKGKNKTAKKNISFAEKRKFTLSGVDSMELFVKKRLWNEYPKPLVLFVISGIKLLKLLRYLQLRIFG